VSEETQRLFFALWPDQVVREALRQQYDEVDDIAGLGRRVAQSNLHITLHYLGNTTVAQKTCFIRQARRVVMQPFVLQLNRLGFFPRASVSWIAPREVPVALKNLHHNLAAEITQCRFNIEKCVYHPHVTMARKLRLSRAPIALRKVLWRVDDFVLAQSVSTPGGVEYRVVERFAAAV
jgi:2'-5' RNA ligase